MTPLQSATGPHLTHDVLNQVPLLAGYDVADDPALLSAAGREGAGWAEAELHELGELAGARETQEHARLANEHPPVLRTHDARGHRIDEVEFHPSWHVLLGTAVGHGLHAAPWADAAPGAHVARAAKFLVWSQAEAGHGCPVSMTYAALPPLRHAPDLARRFAPLLTARDYDPGLRAPEGKAALLAGMAMLTCFLLPRVRPDGTRNAVRLQRLKDKLGNRSNASAEVEFDAALAWQVGEAGRGVPTIIEMVSATRLDCVLGSAAGMRLGAVTAVHYTTHRRAFGASLISQPLMASVLADLVLESEAATTLALRLAGAADRAARGDEAEAALLRVALPAAKHWVCKRAPLHAAEALECLGGNGYVEESGMPRLYREAPLNSIWEGSANVTALDLLRGLQRQQGAADALAAELSLAAGGDPRLDAAISGLGRTLRDLATRPGPEAQFAARRLAGSITVTLQAALLVRHAPAAVADAFCASRLGSSPGVGTLAGPGVPFGTLPDGLPVADILGRAAPVPR